jgi:hypothetical protein
MTMMACGCAANAKRKTDNGWIPTCAVHNTVEQVPDYDLTGRQAICCGESSLRDSDADKLAFFEYRGPGSKSSDLSCTCGYAKMAHTSDKTHVMKHCAKKNGVAGFVARGPWEYDRYYCGCRGWD